MTSRSEKDLSTTTRTINNAIFNVFGWLWPIGLNLLTLPYIVNRLGAESFGIFALILAILGYFAFLNLGLNAASIKYIAEYWTKGDSEKTNLVIGSTLVIYATLGGLGSLGIWLAAGWLVTNVLKVSPDLVEISKTAFRVGALGFLANMVSGTFRAVPTALQRFDITNKATIGFTTLSTLSTVAVLAMGGGLVQVVVIRFAISLLSILVFLFIAKRLVPSLVVRPRCTWPILKELLSFGGFSAVNRVAAQAIFQLDRLLVGSFLGPTAVTYYVIPANLSSQVHRLTTRLTSVLFPLSSELSARGEGERLRKMYIKTTKYITILTTAIYLPVILLSSPLLRFWMGQNFADQSGSTLSVLALSFYVLSFNAVAYHILNGIGRPDINAVSAVIGGLINVGLCLLLIPKAGIFGAAAANLISMARIPVYILYANKRALKVSSLLVLREAYLKPWLIGGGVVIPFLLLGISPASIGELLSVSAVLVFLYIILAIMLGVFDAEDKALLLNYLESIFRAVSHKYPFVVAEELLESKWERKS